MRFIFIVLFLVSEGSFNKVKATAITIDSNERVGIGAVSPETALDITGAVTTVAGTGSSGSANGTGTSASFNNPIGITTDGTNLYVADPSNHLIRKIE